MHLGRRLWLSIAGMAMFAPLALAQGQQGQVDPLNSPLTMPPPGPSHAQQLRYRDLNLLRRGGFSEATGASVSVRIFDRNGTTPAGLQAADFQLIVNKTPRVPRVHAPGVKQFEVSPLVLLVLPPNQPIVHSIALRNAEKYFAQQPGEQLPWRVGIFDSNAKLTPFTNGRTQLLANLSLVEHSPEPFQYASDAGLPARYRWDGSWLSKAEDAIALMQRYDGPKIILAINPLAERQFGLNEQMFAQDGPETLVGVAHEIGAHIYIANVGGPEVYVPGGDAARDQPAQIVGPGGNLRLGTSPSYHMQVDPQMVAALNYYAYRTSEMMQTAADTLGGFSNSLNELAGKIHRDLDGNYALDFDLTPEDTDRGAPDVEVRMVRHDLKVAILDVVPLGAKPVTQRERLSRQLLEAMSKAGSPPPAPVRSPEFRLTQQVDSFPIHAGLEPVLPMRCTVEWTGSGRTPPQSLAVAEVVEDVTLGSPVLERSIDTEWDGRSFSWERDGALRPGSYVWRVAVHDSVGRILASSEQKVEIEFPRHLAMAASSLAVGRGCGEASRETGLQPRSAAGDQASGTAHPILDPMQAANCRLTPDARGRFAAGDLLHAFVRIYPEEKLEKRKPESWTARFALRSAAGIVETESSVPFTSDSGSGFLAAIAAPLGGAGISPGPHMLDVSIHGPGIHGELSRSRAIWIVPAADAPADAPSAAP